MKLVMDIECYPNYFLIMFYNVDSKNVLHFEIHNDEDSTFDRAKIKRLMSDHTINESTPRILVSTTGMPSPPRSDSRNA